MTLLGLTHFLAAAGGFTASHALIRMSPLWLVAAVACFGAAWLAVLL